MDDLGEQFPIGMSVLAVDDDRICLKILETLLLRCQYNVMTATNAITALDILRKNKKKFDLVISDVHMPDMDGFKLLELIGLEMDLPVIMLSGNDDPNMVMKGISHGACYYLLKPVRIEELKNIWQHVVRKKKISKTRIQDAPKSDSCNGLNSAVTTNSNPNEKSSKKRKEHSHDDDADEEHENDHDNDDPTAHKRPRVVWSVELHRKFLAAVNQLGVDKAVPKKILDLMDVENLTRENVASHLQKYRLYLKRNSCVENQQANMMPLNGSRQFHNNAFTSFKANHGMPSSQTFQLLQRHNLSNYRSKVPMGCTTSPFLDISNNALMSDSKVGGPYKNLASNHSQFSTSLLGNDIWSNALKSQGVSNNVSLQGWINHNQDGISHSHAGGELGGLDSSFGEPLGMNQLKFQNSGVSSNFGSLEDILSTVISKQIPDNVKFMDGYTYDNYSSGTSM